MSSPHLLPDSRLAHRPDFEAVCADWSCPDGTVVRIEMVPIFCGSCGTMYGWVPRANTTFVSWLCRQCFEQYGTVCGTYAVPEDEFNRAVAHEMEARFGRHLSDVELAALAEQGRLGPMLEALERDSPYPARNNRPKG